MGAPYLELKGVPRERLKLGKGVGDAGHLYHVMNKRLHGSGFESRTRH